jgi:hypothetical protein
MSERERLAHGLVVGNHARRRRSMLSHHCLRPTGQRKDAVGDEIGGHSCDDASRSVLAP